jgi:hypothetical protein
MELRMAGEKKLSPEGEALAEAFGAMMAGFAFELHTKAQLPRPLLMAALGRGLLYIETNKSLEAPQDARDAIAAAMRRTALI